MDEDEDENKLIEIQPKEINTEEDMNIKYQRNISKCILISLSPLLCCPLCLWNDCIRDFCNKYSDHIFPPVGIIENQYYKEINNKHINESFLYQQSPTYSTTLCCVDFHIYDPFTIY